MAALRRRHNALGARKHDPGLKTGVLMYRPRFYEFELLEVTDERGHSVIAQSAGVEAGRNERGAQRMHLHERREMRCIAEIVGVSPARERGTGGRLARNNA